MINVILAAFHLFALVAGLSAIVQRAILLKSGSVDVLRRVFRADLVWGVAAGLWIVTGLIRLLFGMDKDRDYYLHSSTFLAKMALSAAVIALEIWPMIKLIKFRKQVARRETPDAGVRRRVGLISYVEASIVVVMVFLATAMARGY